MKKMALVYVMAAGLAVGAVVPMVGAETGAAAEVVKGVESVKPKVQIAILLDTSGSMDGLIEQAKTQLWKVVNEFAKGKVDGKRPEIEVALYHYGNDGLASSTGYVKQLTPLTTDLDKVSEELFKLKTNGGSEYCGTVIQAATKELEWSKEKNAYKAIFIAGNEPFTQGSVDYKESCKAAITKGIIVNTIHCGSEKEGIERKWKDGAVLADGSFMVINQDQKIVPVVSPQDKEIAELSGKINETYVGYGKKGEEGVARQAAQDQNAAKASPSSAAERGSTKGGNSYTNSEWDLVDAVKDGKAKLSEVKEDDLPAELKKLSVKEREEYVAKKLKEREDIQAKLKELSVARDKYIAEKRKDASGDKTLDTAIIEAVRTQAKRVDMKFEEGK